MLKQISYGRLLISILHAGWMLVVLYLCLDVFPIFGDEKLLMDMSVGLQTRARLPEKDFVFVNVHQDKQLIRINQDVGKEVITDRRLLTYFLRFLNEQGNQHRFLIYDIYFLHALSDSMKVYDDSLRIEFGKTKNFMVAGVPDTSGKGLAKQVFPNLPEGLVSIVPTGKSLYRWQLVQHQIKTLPLLMYEKIQARELPALHRNNMPLHYYIFNADLDPKNTTTPTYDSYLYQKKFTYFGSLEDFEALVTGGEALKEARKELYDKSFKGKIILVGDFSSSDMHLTQVGRMYGSLILLNSYLSLLAGQSHIRLGLILFWFLAFAVISYRALYVETLKAHAWLLPVLRFPLFRYLDYLWLLLGLSFISYFLFGVHIHVVVFFVYLKAVRYGKMGGKLQQLEKDLAIEHAKSEKLLLNIMPKDIAEELKSTGKTEIRHYPSATILFADVKGFSKKAEELKKTSKTPAKDLIALLDATFSEMDKISEKYGLERIKTIGDCYMAVGGVPVANQTHPVDVALAALAIQKWMADEKKKRNGDFWEVRLGFHTGELMAGVIGTQRFAYDVWGSDVNIASRMESGGEIGRVNTTEYTKNLIEAYFEVEYRGEIEAKNIGLLRAFFVNRIKPELSKDAEGFEPNERFWERRRNPTPALPKGEGEIPEGGNS